MSEGILNLPQAKSRLTFKVSGFRLIRSLPLYLPNMASTINSLRGLSLDHLYLRIPRMVNNNLRCCPRRLEQMTTTQLPTSRLRTIDGTITILAHQLTHPMGCTWSRSFKTLSPSSHYLFPRPQCVTMPWQSRLDTKGKPNGLRQGTRARCHQRLRIHLAPLIFQN